MSITSKLSHQIGEQWVSHSYAPEYKVERTVDGGERLVVGLPAGDTATISSLVACLEPPYLLLCVVHTPRGEGAAGRYQSPELAEDDMHAFFDRYAPFLSGDARFDLWVYSPNDSATVVLDRHNLVYAYGPLDAYLAVLNARGFLPGNPNANFVHQHHYRAEFDADAARLLGEYNWQLSPLRPEDEQ